MRSGCGCGCGCEWGWSYCMFELFQYTECLLADTCRSAQVRLVNTQRDSATAAMILSWSPSLRSLSAGHLSLSLFLSLLPLCLFLSLCLSVPSPHQATRLKHSSKSLADRRMGGSTHASCLRTNAHNQLAFWLMVKGDEAGGSIVLKVSFFPSSRLPQQKFCAPLPP